MKDFDANFSIKQKIVLAGNSKVFKYWQMFLPNLTEEVFLSALKWVCDDPLNEKGRLTREIGLTRKGIVKIKRVYDTKVVGFYDEKGKLWTGDYFRVPCTKDFVANPEKVLKYYADKDGTIQLNFKLSLNAKDRV